VTAHRPALGVALALAVAGCLVVGPSFERPAPPKVARYTNGSGSAGTVEAAGRTQHFLAGKRVQADWWRLFGSREIDALVAETIAGNPSLDAARASLRRGQASLRAGYGVFFPQLDAQAGANYQRLSLQRFGQSNPPSEFALYSLSGSVSYALDLWGGERRQVEALAAQVEAQRYSMAGVYVMLTANVVSTVIARAAYQAQVDATRGTIALEREQLEITEAQVTAGTVPYANVLAIRSQLAATEASIPVLEQQADQASHLLATLTGRPPADAPRTDVALERLALPLDVPLTLPAQLVRQRPDVLVAEAQLHSANAAIGVATAAMLPNITLTGDLGVNNSALGSLFGAAGRFWSLGGGLTAPIFHGGALNEQRKAAIAARDQAAATYRETVLSAFAQVADALRGLQHDAEALRAQREALDAAEQALKLIQVNYKSGIATYLQVLIANQQYLQAKLAYVRVVAQRLQDTVALYAALGGGWWDARF
jgi:NodT family efflux transporter outer membrane factor (OMF) lipoprotein